MLDFYGIADSLSTPEDPEDLNLVLIDSLDIKLYDRLQQQLCFVLDSMKRRFLIQSVTVEI